MVDVKHIAKSYDAKIDLMKILANTARKTLFKWFIKLFSCPLIIYPGGNIFIQLRFVSKLSSELVRNQNQCHLQ